MMPPLTATTKPWHGGTGYIPTDRHIAENDPNLGDWCWVAPGSEPRLLDAIAKALQAKSDAKTEV
jgi:hypothetical protein